MTDFSCPEEEARAERDYFESLDDEWVIYPRYEMTEGFWTLPDLGTMP